MYAPFRSIVPTLSAAFLALCVTTTLIASTASLSLTALAATAPLV